MGPGAPFRDDVCVHDLVAEAAEREAGRIAVVFEGNDITYAELDRRANAVAHLLADAGAGPGKVVGFHAERSIEMIVGLLGIMRSGAASVALDPSYPSERLAFMLRDSSACIVLSDEQVASPLCFEELGIPRVDLRSVSEPRGDSPFAKVSPSDPMYVIYTSGSTGKPKGVLIRHRSVVNLLTCAGRCFPLGPGDTVGAVSTFAFDISITDFWLSLIRGARICVVPRLTVTDPRRLGELIADSRVTLMQTTPSIWQTLVNARWDGSSDLVAISAGEPLSPLLAKELRAKCASLWNAYGPTETTVWATLEKVEDFDPVSIGRPLANTRVHILDEHLDQVPVSCTGEIVIGGVGVSGCYLNRPDETERRFVPDPFEPGQLLYRTGDLARFLPDGRIQYLGRMDDQIKYHGFRIEPAEIESALKGHPNVQDAVVAKREDVPGRPMIVAYVVPDASQPTESELRQLLRKTLPEYMVPGAFVFLDCFPYTASGKLDRLSLPALDLAQRGGGTSSPPASELESRLLETWKRVLGLGDLGVEDDFFESGGDSLMAWELVVAAGECLETELPVSVLLEKDATVRGMAHAIEELHSGSGDDRDPGSRPRLRSLFCLVPDETALIGLRHIQKALEAECNVIGILCGGLGQRVDTSKTVEDLADDALLEIRERQPRGPYMLSGFSLGGLVAYAVTGRLRREGEAICFLCLLDTCVPTTVARQIRWRAKFARHRGRVMRRALHKVRNVRTSQNLHAWVNRQIAPIAGFPADAFDLAGTTAAALRHRVLAHDSHVELFLSDATVSLFGETGGWDELHPGQESSWFTMCPGTTRRFSRLRRPKRWPR